jgi:peptidoglycan hydrolase-like protein with peptidoglycan-binding domain
MLSVLLSLSLFPLFSLGAPSPSVVIVSPADEASPEDFTVVTGSPLPLRLRTSVDLSGSTVEISSYLSNLKKVSNTEAFESFEHADKVAATTGCFNAPQCTAGEYRDTVRYWSAIQTNRGVISKTDPCSKAIQLAVGTSTDGWYGSGTETAVRAFQQASNEAVSDGKCQLPCHNNPNVEAFPNCPAENVECGADGCGGTCSPNCCDSTADYQIIQVDGYVGQETWPRIRNQLEKDHCQLPPLQDPPGHDGFPTHIGAMAEETWNLLADPAHKDHYHYSEVLTVPISLTPQAIDTLPEDTPDELPLGRYTGKLILADGTSFSFGFTIVENSCVACAEEHDICMEFAQEKAHDVVFTMGQQCWCQSLYSSCLRNAECGAAAVTEAERVFNQQTGCSTNPYAALTGGQCEFCHPLTSQCTEVPLTGVCAPVLGSSVWIAVENGQPALGELLAVDEDRCDSYALYEDSLNADIFWRDEYPATCRQSVEDYNPFSSRNGLSDECPGCQITQWKTGKDGPSTTVEGACAVDAPTCKDAWYRLKCSAPRDTVFCSPAKYGITDKDVADPLGAGFVSPVKPFQDICTTFEEACNPNFVTDQVLGTESVQGDACSYIPYFEGVCGSDAWARRKDNEFVGVRNFTRAGLMPDAVQCRGRFETSAECCDAWADKAWFVQDKLFGFVGLTMGPGEYKVPRDETVRFNGKDVTCTNIGGPNYPNGDAECTIGSSKKEFTTRLPSNMRGPDSCCRKWETGDDHPLFPNSNELAGCRRAAAGKFDLSYYESTVLNPNASATIGSGARASTGEESSSTKIAGLDLGVFIGIVVGGLAFAGLLARSKKSKSGARVAAMQQQPAGQPYPNQYF